ncbi:MAG TPA: diguanylate cyclase [Candidatus Sulfotelmatobacter sp.]|nr:diguanylate cyclase [Candidatus Sulfotelmatobacter sp.]
MTADDRVSTPAGNLRAVVLGRAATSAPILLHGIYDYRLTTLLIGLAALALSIAAVLAGRKRSSLLKFLRRAVKTTPANDERLDLSFRTVAQAIPAIIWTARPDGSVDFMGEQLYRYSGFTKDKVLGWSWENALHPDDLPACLKRWEHCVRTGEVYEMEYRIRRADGVDRWFIARANPLRDDEGRIIQWVGTCTDIEEQKHNQQLLEQQIKERTEELGEANARLQQEMQERDSARQELDRQNEKMLLDLTARSQRATQLAKMAEMLQSCISKEEVFAAALGFAPKVFTGRGAVALLNAERNLVEVAGSWHDCHLPVPVFEPSACWALRTAQPHLVVAGDTTARCAHASGVKNTYLCIPILAQGEALGIMHFQATDDAPTLGDSELWFKTTFAGQVGLSVANIRLREALRAQSIKDPLTALYNRRYLTEMLEREIRRAVRAEQSLGILMLDLDHFKKFNDTYGHDAGDTVLRETALFLSNSIRMEDFVCRYGGEEFVVILPTADLNASHARAERMRSKLRELVVLHQGQSLGMITVSIGVAALPQHGTSSKALLEAADAALYRAKREGRDRVAVAEPRLTADEQPLTAENHA